MPGGIRCMAKDMTLCHPPSECGAIPAVCEQALVQRAQAAETELFELLVRRYDGRLRRVARRVLRDDADAEDAVQDAYLHALAGLGGYSGRGSIFTWLTRITINEALTCLRNRRRSPTVEILSSGRGGSGAVVVQTRTRNPEQQVLRKELHHALDAAVDALPEPYRAVVRLREMEESSTADVAASLGLTEQCVKTRLHRAKKLLRKRLGEPIILARSEEVSQKWPSLPV